MKDAARSHAGRTTANAGVDIIQGRDGRFLVLEVNSMPAWNGLQQVTRINISDFVVDAFLAASLRRGRLKGREVL